MANFFISFFILFNLHAQEDVVAEINPKDWPTPWVSRILKLNPKNGNLKNMKVSKRNIEFRVYDNSQTDGDTVSIFVNDQPVLEAFAVSKKTEIIPISLNKGINKIRIISNSTGKVGPNTAKMRITDVIKEAKDANNFYYDTQSWNLHFREYGEFFLYAP